MPALPADICERIKNSLQRKVASVDEPIRFCDYTLQMQIFFKFFE